MIPRVFMSLGRWFGTKRKPNDTFRFPSHKPYFNDQYFRNKYIKETVNEGMTMNAYKQLFGKKEAPAYNWDMKRYKMETTIKDYIDKSDAQTMIKTTKEVLKRKALNREFDFIEERRKKLIEDQYGDYDKYLKNYTEVKEDKLDEERDKPMSERVVDLKKKLEKDPIGIPLSATYEKLSRYIRGVKVEKHRDIEKLKPPPDWNLNEEEKRLFDHLILQRLYGDGMLRGRLSPFAKEEIYDLYKQGWTVNDISHKFGILTERVHAVIFQRQLFWEEIYPRMGETALSMGMKLEMLYGQQYGFLDYGLDLDIMAHDARSLRFIKVRRSKSDRLLAPFEKQKIIDFYKFKRPNNKYTHIPEKLAGKGTKAYMIKSMQIWGGKGRVRPSKAFANACRYVHKYEHWLLPDKVRKRLKLGLGPREASKGYHK